MASVRPCGLSICTRPFTRFFELDSNRTLALDELGEAQICHKVLWRPSAIYALQRCFTRCPSENAVGLNPFYDEPYPSLAVASSSPPEIAVRLIARLGEFGRKVLDRIDCVFACRIWIRDRSTVYHVVVRIERQLDHLKRGPDHQSHPEQSTRRKAIGAFYTNTPSAKLAKMRQRFAQSSSKG